MRGELSGGRTNDARCDAADADENSDDDQAFRSRRLQLCRKRLQIGTKLLNRARGGPIERSRAMLLDLAERGPQETHEDVDVSSFVGRQDRSDRRPPRPGRL